MVARDAGNHFSKFSFIWECHYFTCIHEGYFHWTYNTILSWRFFFFFPQHFKVWHFLLLSLVSDLKTEVIQIITSLWVISLFLIHCLVFISLIIWSRIYFFSPLLPLLGFTKLKFVDFSQFGEVFCHISSNIFLVSYSFSSSSETLMTQILDFFYIVPKVSEDLYISFFFFQNLI